MAILTELVDILKQIWVLRPVVFTLVAVFGVLPLAILVDTSEGRCAYVLIVMAIMWLTEAIPIPATALLPIFMFPMVGVMPAKAVSKNYITDSSMLFFGGLIVAVAVEEWQLHRRIALGVLRVVGANPMWIMLGLMLPTWFLSMWISNTATTSMMIPIVQAVLQQLRGARYERTSSGEVNDQQLTCETDTTTSDPRPPDGKLMKMIEMKDKQSNQQEKPPVNGDKNTDMPAEPAARKYNVQESDNGIEDGTNNEEFTRICKGLSLCIAYAANIGGISTLTGTPPNLVFKGQADQLFEKYKLDSGITFASWMVLALPLSAITLAFAWGWLVLLFIRFGGCRSNPEIDRRVARVIREEFHKMGSITMAEIITLILFVFLAVMWLSRDPQFSPGWGSWFVPKYVSDSSAAILIAVLLFILPAKKPIIFCWRKVNGIRQKPSYTPLLNWEMVHRKLPWGVIILLGGGFALADACKVSGLSKWVGRELASLGNMDPWVLNLILCLIVAGATEVTSNTATATLLLPIMAELAVQIGVNPLYLMASTAVATSFAFMLPVATPPNAIVFSHGYLRIPDMAMAGLLMNFIAVGCLTLAVNTWGEAYFHFKSLPHEFMNSTI